MLHVDGRVAVARPWVFFSWPVVLYVFLYALFESKELLLGTLTNLDERSLVNKYLFFQIEFELNGFVNINIDVSLADEGTFDDACFTILVLLELSMVDDKRQDIILFKIVVRLLLVPNTLIITS
mmetsp:Transcript_18446/g.24770  ORF Transcript_18446/g.24770 Transcript_18446/m.24770 type:complete len:124 (-) Transcript_18446:625-996(-)